MSREKSEKRENLIPNALMQFWEFGYYGTSVEDLVSATGLSRSSLYSEFKNKKELFKACLRFYTTVLADESVSHMEKENAGINELRKYFDCVLNGLRDQPLPYKGCFLGNTMSESSPHDIEIHEIVEEFNSRLSNALLNVLKNETNNKVITTEKLKQISQSWMTSIHGIWAYSRSVQDYEELECAVEGFIFNTQSSIKSI